MVATDNRRARTRPSRSPVNSVTPALSIATSVPPPIAMPTSAAASAGASLTPSPTMATRRPSPRSRCTTSLLRSGNTPASTSSMPSAFATARAVVDIVAGQHHDAQAVGAQRRKRRWRRRLDRIGNRDHAGGAAVDRDKDRGGAAAAARPRRPASSAVVAMFNSAISTALPSATALPSTVAGRALAGRRGKIADVAEIEPALACAR